MCRSASSSRAAASKQRMNSRPMILRFASGIGDPVEGGQELVGRVDHLELDPGRG